MTVITILLSAVLFCLVCIGSQLANLSCQIKDHAAIHTCELAETRRVLKEAIDKTVALTTKLEGMAQAKDHS
jgi:hypothetical protein